MYNSLSRIVVLLLPLPLSVLAVLLVGVTLLAGFGPRPVESLQKEHSAQTGTYTPSSPDYVHALPVDDVRQSDPQVVQNLREATDAEAAHLEGIQHFLEDKLRVQQGEAPLRWAQPPLREYLAPGAPDSLIPSK